MPIKKRITVPVIDYSEKPKANWFENVGEPKPKKPLPDKAVIPPDATPSLVRRIGYVLEDEILTLNVNDMLTAVRTPRNPGLTTELRARARIKNRGTAITAMCMDCQGQSRKRVTECTTTDCPLWGFRFGSDPMRGMKK